MTSTPEKQPASLKAVPPNQIKPSTQSAPKSREMPAQESIPVPEESGINWGRIVFLCAVVGGGFWLSQLEVPVSVRGEAKLTALQNNIHPVYLKEPGRIDNFLVQHGDRVQAGETLAEVQSQDLKEEILAEQIKLQEEQAKLTSAEQKIGILRSQESEAEQRVRAMQRQVDDAQEDVNRLLSSSPPPEIEIINHEIASIDRDIQGLEPVIVSVEEEIQIHQDRLEKVSQAIDEGAISIEYQLNIETEIKRLERELETSKAKVGELESNQFSKKARIDAIRQNLERDLENVQDELRMEEERLETVRQELESAEQEKLAQAELVNMRQKAIAALQEQQDKNQTLKAEHEGIVFAENLSENKGKWLERHDQIMKVVKIDPLEATIFVDQADLDLLQPLLDAKSAEVKLKPRQPGYKPQTVKLSDMEPVAQPDPSQTTKQVVLTATVDNSNEKELINGEFYAEIQVGSLPLYERVRREAIKVLKLRQYF